MLRSTLHGVSLFFCVLPVALAPTSHSQNPARIVWPIDNSSRVAIPQSHLAWINRAIDLGPLDESLPLDRMVLLLKRSPEQQQALDALLVSQQTKGSSDYHAWLTPQQFGRRFGPAPEDLAQITSWLQQQGFRIDSVAGGGMWIEFSGTAGQVNAAFHAQMHRYQINGANHIANSADISIPAALSPVVRGLSLHDFFAKPMLAHIQTSSGPQITAPWNGAHAIIPGDFAIIYDLSSLYKAGLNGAGQTIAVVGESDINLTDIATFQSVFGLPSNSPTIIHNGFDPGEDVNAGYGLEASIDTEWASAVAPGASIDLVVSAPAQATDGAALSALYIVDQNLAQIVSVSFGECEQDLGADGNALWSALWEQAAAQGMSVFVASGDQGSVTCNSDGLNLLTGYGPDSVNGLASTPFNTAVGGTEFYETVNGGVNATFWNTANASNLSSVTGYIPETVWNESCDDKYNIYLLQQCPTTLPSLGAGGGGPSTIYPAPSWQTLNVTGLNTLATYSLPNQPGVAPRGVPDVSLDAAGIHDGYLLCFTAKPATPDCQLSNGVLAQTTFQNEAGGTSFSAPEFAGIMAIVNQAEQTVKSPSPTPVTDGRQGLANYTLYALAAAETYTDCNSSTRTNPAQPAPAGCVFNDITFGNNAPPQTYTYDTSVVGYGAAAGYDLASGLGSVDAARLVAGWTSAAAAFHGSQATLSSGSGTNPISIQHGQPVTLDVTVQKLAGDSTSQSPSGDISLIARGGSLAGSAGMDAQALTPGANGSATTGSFTAGDLPAGNYNLIADFPGDGTFAASISNAIPVTVTPENSVTTLNVYQYTNGYGTPVTFDVQVAGVSGQGFPSGAITLADSGAPFATLPLDSSGETSLVTCLASFDEQFFPVPSALPCFGAGLHQFSATYAGDTSFNTSPTPPAVSQLASTTIPKGNLDEIGFVVFIPEIYGLAINQPVPLGAELETNPLGPPTASIQFSLNSNAVGQPVPLTPFAGATGVFQATLPNVTLQQGSYTLSASYPGDSNYNPLSVSNTVSWGIPLGWIAPSISATVDPGQTATFNLTLGNASFIGQSSIVCTSGTWEKPATMPEGVACNVSPSMVNLTSASQTVPVTVTIATTNQSRLESVPFHTLPFALPPVLAMVLWRWRRKQWPSALACIIAILVLAGISSCGGSGGPPSPPPPPAATAQFTIWATMDTSGNANPGTTPPNGSNTVTLTVNINP
jgi:hypothetical protein